MRSRLFFIAYLAGNVALILYGLTALLRPSLLLEPFSQYVYAFPTEGSAGTAYLMGLFRLLGVFNVLLGALSGFLLLRYQLSKQAWLLPTVVASTLLAYLAAITFDNTVGHIGLYEVIEHLLFATIVLATIFRIWPRKQVSFRSQKIGA